MKQQSALNKLSNLFEKTGVTDANVIITNQTINLNQSWSLE